MPPANKPKIIIANSHVWGGALKIGAEHLAEQFHNDGWSVLYLSSPLSPLHILHTASRKRALQKLKMRRPILADQKENFHLLCPLTLIPHINKPFFNSNFTLSYWFRLTLPLLRSQIASLGFADAQVILFDNIVYWPLLQLYPGKKIYRLADRIERFPVITNAMLGLHKTILAKADLVVYTAHDLEDLLAKRTGRSVFLPNGVDYKLFSTPVPEPVEYKKLQGSIILYMGAIEDWFDFEAFNEATAWLPDKEFVLIAPPTSYNKRIIKRSNVHFLGSRPHSDLPAYAQHADLGLIPFDMKRHKSLLESVCPLKLFEYLAAGLPVISYDSKEIRKSQAPVTYFSKRKPLHVAIGENLEKKAAIWTSDTLQNFSLQSDWKSRYTRLQSEIRK